MKQALPILVLLAALAAIVTGVRFGFDRGPFERVPVGPEASYWRQAQALQAGNQPVADLEARSDTYLKLLAPLTGDGPGAVTRARRILSAVFLPLIGLLTATLAWRRAGPWPSVAAGAAAALSAPIILPSGSFDPALPATVLLLVALVILDGKPTVPAWILGGLVAGVAAFLQPVLGWAFLLAATVWLVVRPPALPRGAAAGLLAAGWLAGAVAPALVFGSGSVVPEVDAVELYRGHRTQASGLVPRRADRDAVRWWTAEDFWIQASIDKQRLVTADESEQTWRLRALSEAVRAPHREAMRVALKTWAALQAQPLPFPVGSRFIETESARPGLRITTWLGALVLPLGLAGLLAGRRRAGWLLGVGLLTAPVAAWITYAVPETRLVTVSVLAVGFGLFLRLMADGPRRLRLRLAAGGLAAVAVCGVLPRYALPGQGVVSQDHFHLGSLYEKEGRGSAAMREFERATRLDETNPYPRLAVAGMLAKDQVLDESIRELEVLRELHPDFIRGLEMLARSYAGRGRWEEAVEVYGVLTGKMPWRPDYANEIGTIYLQAGYFDQAQAWFQRALQIEPTYTPARANLDGMKQKGLALQGTREDTPKSAAELVVEYLRQAETANLAGDAAGVAAAVAAADSAMDAGAARWRDPATGKLPAPLRFVEGTLRFKQARYPEAIAAYEDIYSLMSSSEVFLNNLASAYAENGQLEDAIKTWSQALRINPGNSVINDQLRRAREQLDLQKQQDGK